MGTFFEEGGEAILHYALGLKKPADTGFFGFSDPEWSSERKGGSTNTDLLGTVPSWIWSGDRVLRDALRENLRREEKRFQRSEQLSVIYSQLHLVTRLAAYRYAVEIGDKEMVEALRKWLSQFWVQCRLTSSRSGGRELASFVGERSSGVPIPNWYGQNLAWDLACHGPRSISGQVAGWIKAISKAGAVVERELQGWDHTNSWIDCSLCGFWPEISETAAFAVSQPVREVVKQGPGFTYRERVYFYVTDRGYMQWWGKPGEDASCNSNTGPLGLVKCDGGSLETSPPNGGEHYRMKPANLVTSFESVHYNHGEVPVRVRVKWSEIDLDQTINAPGGDPLGFWMVDPERGWVDMLNSEPVVAPGPVPEEPQEPSPMDEREYDEAANLLIHVFKPLYESLNETNTTQEERAFLASELGQMASRWKEKKASGGYTPWWKKLLN